MDFFASTLIFKNPSCLFFKQFEMNLHTHTVQLFKVCNITIINFRIIFVTSERNPLTITSLSHLPPIPSCSRHFIWKELFDTRIFVTLTWHNVFKVYSCCKLSTSFLFMVNHISLYEYITFCLSICQLMDIKELFLPFDYCQWCYSKHLCRTFCVDVFLFLGFVSRSGVARSYDNCLSAWGTARLFFHSGFTILQSHQVYEGSGFSISFLALVNNWLFDMGILVGVKWYFIVVLICVSVMSNDAVSYTHLRAHET